METDLTPELRRELLDDFYAECDELLTAVRDGLIQLERAGSQAAPDADVLEALFRNTHSIKGNSAIVGLRAAEQVAHGMEDVFRDLTGRTEPLAPKLLETLLTATQRLESIIAANRHSKPPPATEDMLSALRKFLPANPAKEKPARTTTVASTSTAAADAAASAQARGLNLYNVAFTPSPALNERGINVTSVRERLGKLGEILSATPSVRQKGSITFEFVVGLREEPVDLKSWLADEIHFTPAPTVMPAGEKGGVSSDTSLALTPSHIVRVDLARLDDLMRITGEMVIQRSRLEDRLQQGGQAFAGLKEINLAFNRSLREMREAVARVRMVPIAEIFSRMPFVVRDLMRDSDRKVRVVLEGNHTEVDKYLVERLKEPLLHLVRNAFAHGIESADERVRLGKPAEATITLRAKSAGESVVIQVQDDGRGVDPAEVMARARNLGLPVPASGDAANLLRVLCTPGFSTRAEADLAAGRGVGMTVVATTVRELGGVLTLETTQGRGTQFSLKLPLTLSIADVIIVAVGQQTCAIPQSAVDEIVQAPANELRSIKDTELIPYRGGLLPLVRLRTMFGLDKADPAQLTFLVVTTERGAAGLVVDQLRSQREVVIRPLADPLLRVPGISGATELGDGRPVLILDPAAITQRVVRPPNLADQTELKLSQALPT